MADPQPVDWIVRPCPGHPINGDPNTCTHEHLPGILYTHDHAEAPSNG